MTFSDVFKRYDWDDVRAKIYGKGRRDVMIALNRAGKCSLEDFMALLSPAALPFLEEMAVLSSEITGRRFGRTVQLYIPLYLSNKCGNNCLYCGFRRHNRIKRVTLNEEQVLNEVKIIKSYGFDHVLLVTGESKSDAGVDYLEKMIKLIRPYFAHISIEVQPMGEKEYKRLAESGVNTVLVYQETYGRDYPVFHPSGPKSDFFYRLETPDRIGEAGVHKIGLGCLLGLDDWRTDSWYVGLHVDYLERKFWKTRYSISFPRLRPATGIIEPRVSVSDREMVQLICAYRLFNENLELSISTRESEKFRNNVVRLGVTAISAGSKTDPGGYSAESPELEQFEINDGRTPEQVAHMIKEQGYEPVWKDWDMHYGVI